MFEFLQNNIFYSPEKIKEINEAQRAAAASNSAAPKTPKTPKTPETQAEKTARINAAVQDLMTPRGYVRSGAAGMMSGSSAIPPKTPPTAQPPKGSRGLPANYKETEARAFVDARRARGEVPGLPTDYKQTEQQAGAAAEKFRPGAGFTGTGRGEKRKNLNDVEQTGTDMGGRVMTMEDMKKYLGKDVQLANPFLSNALPGTNDDGFALPNSPVIKTIDGKEVEGGAISINEYNTRFSNDNKPVEVQKTEGSADLVQSGAVKVNDIKDSSTWTEDYARRRAFLDADDSMSGLKAAQAQKGIVYAGGQHNLVNPNAGQEGENDFIKIDRSDAQAYMRGAQGAEDLKAKYIDKIKASKPAPFENVGDTPIISSPVESPIDMNESPADFVAPLTDMPAYTDKDHTGRFNMFRRS